MGLVFGEVTFEGRAPDFARVAEAMTALCGLSVGVSLEHTSDHLYDQNATVYFSDAPDSKIEMHTYQPGVVLADVREMAEGLNEEGFQMLVNTITGANEPPGHQAVHLCSHVAQEPTLHMVALLALEALGGKPKNLLIDEDRRIYACHISPAELAKRTRRAQRHAIYAGLMMILALPFTLLCLLWQLLRLPFTIQNLKKKLALLKRALAWTSCPRKSMATI